MRIAIVNMVNYGSTGKLMFQIAKVARKSNHDVRTYATDPYNIKHRISYVNEQNHYVWGSFFENMIHYYVGSLLGRNGCYSKYGTIMLIKEFQSFNPDILHLNNLHSHCINLPLLFQYIKKNRIKVVWTLHDCWTFTGQCPHFDMIGCDKWKTSCQHCPQINGYPKSRIDNSKRMYEMKKKLFTGIPNLTLVTPSKWLAGLVKESFLKDYPVKVINNGIDLSVFRPRESSFREKYGIARDTHIVLGVAFGWGYRKGLDVFLKLSETLGKDYQVVLVGTDDNIDQKLPESIISIHRTDNQTELAEIYAAADVFANPTREDTFPTVNMESLACGTPVITFETGGSPEILDETCGIVVPCDDVDAMERAIRHVCEDKPFSQEACLKRAGCFSMQEKFREYVELYEQIAK